MNQLMHQDPFKDLSNMHRQLDDMFGGFWGGWPTPSNLPAMDVYTEGDRQLIAEVHIPGFSKDDVEVNVHEGVLEIIGKKEEKEESKDKKRSYMLRQSSASFYRRVALPRQANADKVKAHFEEGVLKVTVPFKELPKPKKIAIGEAQKK